WLGTLMRGRIRFTSPMLFAIGFVSLFVTGGISGPFLAQPVLDIYLHETYFVIAHFHLIMGVASIFGIFAATYYWFPKMFGRMMNEPLAKLHFWLTFVGAHAKRQQRTLRTQRAGRASRFRDADGPRNQTETLITDGQLHYNLRRRTRNFPRRSRHCAADSRRRRLWPSRIAGL